MNGIIHPCCHPEGTLKPSTEAEMIEFMCRYIDMLLEYIEPKQLLFISIDGPPPRAKIMQQRERRFVKEYESKINTENEIKNETESEWDSNQITPGTLFMSKVANGLKTYMENKLIKCENNNFKILISDSNCPGEGEHKILDFIRNLRYTKNYNCKTSHLLFSNDADMIFLSLLLHETNVYLMRDIPVRKAKRCKQHLFNTTFNIINFKMLIKYLQFDFSKDKLNYKFQYNINRVIDDFVFLSYFIGNDFVPCLPFMNMRDGAFQYILSKYIQIGKHLSDYLVNGARINYKSLQMFLDALAMEENEILLYRMHCFMERINKNGKNDGNRKRKNNSFDGNNNNNNYNKKRKLNNGFTKDIISMNNKSNNKLDIKVLNMNCQNDLSYIKFGTNGYKSRYYKCKFKSELNNNNRNEFINDLKLEYIRGLSWIQYYYYSGIKSWNWCYKYHVAPLISDIANISNLNKFTETILWNNYEKGEPLNPLIQLSLVMPKSSAKIVLPNEYYNAIYVNNNTKKQLQKYYPNTFKMDLNFKELNWESIPIIKHINVQLVKKILNKCQINNQFKKQNALGYNQLYIKSQNKDFIKELHKLWNCSLAATDENENINENNVIKYDIIIPNTFNISQNNRKCIELKNDTLALDEINEKDLNIVSDTMCKYFMSGKKPPRNIVKYMKKRPQLFGKSVQNMRQGTIFKRKNTEKINKTQRFRDMQKKKNNEKKSNDLFIQRLQSIGVNGKMNSTGASNVIIDSVLNAIMNGNNSNNRNNNNNNSKNEIKCKVKVNKNFKKQMKANKFKNMLKNDGGKGNLSVRVENDYMVNTKRIKKKKKKKKKRRKKKRQKKKNSNNMM